MMDSDAANAKMKKPEMKLEVPDVLKVVLVDDWEAVTKNNQVRISLATGSHPCSCLPK